MYFLMSNLLIDKLLKFLSLNVVVEDLLLLPLLLLLALVVELLLALDLLRFGSIN